MCEHRDDEIQQTNEKISETILKSSSPGKQHRQKPFHYTREAPKL
jgi:hypothetical protein